MTLLVDAPDALRVGWCPGVLRPMRVGDGLLVRVKPRGHRLTLPQASGIAEAARRWGNGALTITARGNLQIRGIADDALPALTGALAAHGLLDDSPDGEAVRNVVSNPLAGADPSAFIDLRPAVSAWEDRLACDPALWRLPAKFSWCIDDGGSMALDDVATDVGFAAVAGPDGPALAVTFGGDATTTAICRPDDLVAVAIAIAEAFLRLCTEARIEPHRMRDLVRCCGATAILRRAGLEAVTAFSAGSPRVPLGVGVHRLGAVSVVAATPAFGLLGAATLMRFVDAAADNGADPIRLTPWRGLVAAGLTEAGAAAFTAHLMGSGLILDASDPRLRVAACVGQPGCARATTPVPADAASLAKSLGRSLAPTLATTGRAAPSDIRLHVSGCAKGCAHGGPAPVTLVGRAGAYHLVREGRAGDPGTTAALPLAAFPTMLPALLESCA